MIESLEAILLFGKDRGQAIEAVKRHHYLHSVPSGKSRFFRVGPCIIVYSIPANPYIAQFLLGPTGQNGDVWELSRLWAPDNHKRNLLTRSLSRSLGALRQIEPNVKAIVAYADPNAGHHGGVYKAASWTFCGACEETRLYRSPDGTLVSRRAFHSGDKHLNKAEILALGYSEANAPGKIRWAKGLTKTARRYISEEFSQSRTSTPKLSLL